ncbi:NAD-dependent epimerase/dehydratase family protein [Streptomyces sp. ISL-36]|uniref:NAD-dependent epimerase/dehydratase family protein n=1 Tax=Streptomyces sp. ISL-36 TaxID=2819182 RepID=UPI001BEBFB87|nr:NAD-dependent epimerase/dehydratase family protein [Streptomyces sp. ISL-36]MBT2439117.1 NAD-dependent epimerase/dehydratase family protein [Streptomyces sp. ISL-36]
MAKGNALVLGATGQVGRAAVRALVADGWEVTAASRGGGRDERWPAEVRSVALDRNEEGALAAGLGDGCDVLVDIVAYHGGHGRQLTALADRIGSAVVISSGAVYEDDRGRSFDTQDEPDGFPAFPVPIPESWPTVARGEGTYGTRKVALEQELLAAGEALPTTVLRAGAIHGPYCPGPRELWFVKRALDGRPVRVLSYGGASRFHPVHVDNLAELIRLAAANPGSRVLNGADPQAPTVAEIGRAIDAVMGVESETVLIEGPAVGTVGLTPWTGAHPIVYGMTAAEKELGYRPVVSYEESLPATVEWLTAQLAVREWREAFPGLVKYQVDFFDYAAEDAWLATRA